MPKIEQMERGRFHANIDKDIVISRHSGVDSFRSDLPVPLPLFDGATLHRGIFVVCVCTWNTILIERHQGRD